MNITLIGMPWSGKSYVGKELAGRLKYDFIETDAVLEGEYGLPIREVLEKLGESVFLKKQEEYVISSTKNKDNTVISTGGSIIYTDRAMQYLKEISLIVYLDMPLEVIEKRIADLPRNIVGSKDKNLERLYKERILLYKKWASATVNANQNSKIVVENILKIIENRKKFNKL